MQLLFYIKNCILTFLGEAGDDGRGLGKTREHIAFQWAGYFSLPSSYETYVSRAQSTLTNTDGKTLCPP